MSAFFAIHTSAIFWRTSAKSDVSSYDSANVLNSLNNSFSSTSSRFAPFHWYRASFHSFCVCTNTASSSDTFLWSVSSSRIFFSLSLIRSSFCLSRRSVSARISVPLLIFSFVWSNCCWCNSNLYGSSGCFSSSSFINACSSKAMVSASSCISSMSSFSSFSFSYFRSSSALIWFCTSWYCSCFSSRKCCFSLRFFCCPSNSVVSSASLRFNATASLLFRDSRSFSMDSCFASSSWCSTCSFSIFCLHSDNFFSCSFCCVLAFSNLISACSYRSDFSYNNFWLYFENTPWIFSAACFASFLFFRFMFMVSIFSIASDIGRRSSSDNGWSESLRISLITDGLKSLESFGVLSWIKRSIISLYSSAVSNPKIWRLTYSM